MLLSAITSPITKQGLLAAAATCLCFSLAEQQPAHAAADYCQTDATGAYVCIHSVYGPRSNRGVIYSVNGSMFSGRVNCYDGGYARTSITAIACWAYNAVSSNPDSKAANAKPADPSQLKLITTVGTPSSNNKINADAAKSAMPAEMK